jgi:hypothetical protein
LSALFAENLVVTVLGDLLVGVALFFGQRWYAQRGRLRRLSDKELLWNLREAFDRRAFRGPYLGEQRLVPATWDPAAERNPFDAAIDATLNAVSYGHIVVPGVGDGPPKVIDSQGVDRVADRHRRAALKGVQAQLIGLQSLLAQLRADDIAGFSPAEAQRRLVAAIDDRRDAVVAAMNGLWRELGIPPLPLPTETNPYAVADAE